MSKKDIVYLLMILNVNSYANIILERSLRANEGHTAVNESILTIMKQIWTQKNRYFLEMNSKRCTDSNLNAFDPLSLSLLVQNSTKNHFNHLSSNSGLHLMFSTLQDRCN